MSDVRDDQVRHRYELDVEGQAAFAAYRDEGDVRIFTHTEVPKPLGGRGIGSRLIAAALADVAAQGLKLRPDCSFVAVYIDRHPEFSPLLADGGRPPAFTRREG